MGYMEIYLKTLAKIMFNTGTDTNKSPSRWLLMPDSTIERWHLPAKNIRLFIRWHRHLEKIQLFNGGTGLSIKSNHFKTGTGILKISNYSKVAPAC